MTIIWCMVILSTTDRIFCHFGPFFYTFTAPNNLKNQNFEKMRKPPQDIIILHTCTININHMINGSRNMERDGQNFLSFWTVFCLFTPPNNSKNQNFETMKKISGDIIILHMCTKNDNHMMHGSWDMEHDIQNFLPFWTVFWPFNLLRTQKIKILKKIKKHLKILSFYKCVP